MNLEALPLKDRRVLVRVDFNVPLDNEGKITDDTRIRATLPTLRYILDQGGKPIVMSHLGRPKGKEDPKYSLKPCAKRLEELLKHPVIMAPNCVGSNVEKMAEKLEPGQVLLLENLRFHKGEEDPSADPEFAKSLAKLGDIYVNDAFGVAHRSHSSIVRIAELLEENAPGFLMEKEISFLGSAFRKPIHPFYAIIGGAKISSKLGIIKTLLEKVDALFIGGGMAYTFLEAQGIPVGDSISEKELIPTAKTILETTKTPIFLPKDFVVAKDFSNESEKKIIETSQGIQDGWQGMDIGPLTRQEWKNTLQNAQMIFWNGPLGVFEMPNFAHGTLAIAHSVAEMSATTIVGGGDSVAAINQANLAQKFSHISTGGGASLEYIEKGMLPGIKVLIK